MIIIVAAILILFAIIGAVVFFFYATVLIQKIVQRRISLSVRRHHLKQQPVVDFGERGPSACIAEENL